MAQITRRWFGLGIRGRTSIDNHRTQGIVATERLQGTNSFSSGRSSGYQLQLVSETGCSTATWFTNAQTSEWELVLSTRQFRLSSAAR